MKKNVLSLSVLFLMLTVVFFSCEKSSDVEPIKPTITYKQDAGYTFAATSAKYNDTLKIGINVNYNGTDNLVKFRIYANSQQQLDSTINSTSFSLDIKITKGTADKEVWKFEAIDKANNTIKDSITITGNFGEIKSFGSITLGAQSTATFPSFLSLYNADTLRYMGSQANANQDKVDIFLFYEETGTTPNYSAFAGPASNITGIFPASIDPANYTTKNLTLFSDTQLTAAQFDAVQNDATILASFNAPEGKYKKASQLKTGKVVAFKLQSGKYGLIKIINVTPSPNGSAEGTVEFAIKIQK